MLLSLCCFYSLLANRRPELLSSSWDWNFLVLLQSHCASWVCPETELCLTLSTVAKYKHVHHTSKRCLEFTACCICWCHHMSSSYKRHPLCTQVAQPCETVTQEMGPHSPSELVMVPHQPPPATIYKLSRDAVDVPPPAQPLRCCCASAMCPCITIIASPDTAAEGTTSSRLYLQWTTVPVQESLSGYEGPSVLAC